VNSQESLSNAFDFTASYKKVCFYKVCVAVTANTG